jgi:hypothetical protein
MKIRDIKHIHFMEKSTLKKEETFHYSSEFIHIFKSGLVLHPSDIP